MTLIVQLRALIDYCWCARYPTDLHLLLERLPILYIHIIIRLLQENCSIYTNHEKENEHFCIQSLDQIYSATKKGPINQTPDRAWLLLQPRKALQYKQMCHLESGQIRMKIFMRSSLPFLPTGTLAKSINKVLMQNCIFIPNWRICRIDQFWFIWQWKFFLIESLIQPMFSCFLYHLH